MELEQELKAVLDSKLESIRAAAESAEVSFESIWTYFQQSEQLLINLMNSRQSPPTAPGSIEYSWILYWLNNHAPTAWKEILVDLLKMPPSKISPDDWDKWIVILSGPGVLSGDGSLISTAKFAILDIGWVVALFTYYQLELGIIKRHPFNTNPARKVITGQDTLKVAMFGDWGTGNYKDGNLPYSPSQLVMNQIKAMNPDINIHLGDVYYAGTASEEQTRLLNSWYKAPLANFTMNSNHEMYDGANGLIATALADPIFNEQNQTTYFSIEFGNWLIVGLDSAYYTDSKLFMEGALGQTQINYLKSLDLQGKKLMILTHHNPIPESGISAEQPVLSLWNEVLDEAGITPDYWYWGHIHNGIVYADIPEMRSVKGRCLGNGAIPQGNASWFEKNPLIDFYCNTPLRNPTPDQKNRVTNGFAMLEFSANGGLNEKWYDQDGTLVWSS